MYLELTLDSSENSEALAYSIVQRAAAYRRTDGLALSAAEDHGFKALLYDGPVFPVEKGAMAKYTIPASLPAGSGAQYAPTGPPSRAVISFNPPTSK